MLSLGVFFAIFVKNPEINEGADVRGEAADGAFILFARFFVVSTTFVFEGEPEERAGMVRVDGFRAFIEGDRFLRIAADRADGRSALIEVFRSLFDGSLEGIELLQAFRELIGFAIDLGAP